MAKSKMSIDARFEYLAYAEAVPESEQAGEIAFA